MSSSKCQNSCTPTYDVFLSFRGEDTRRTFVDHLYTALTNRTMKVFKDDEKLASGNPISPELMHAIEESRVAVVVFSKNYAASSWCLDELVKIVECKNSRRLIVVPVFYNVDPSEVRKQKGCFAEAFVKHEKITYTSDKKNNLQHKAKVQRWREALAQVASISGFDLSQAVDGYESKLITQIVGNVWNLVCPTSIAEDDNLIGIQQQVQDFKAKILNEGSDNVYVTGIWGMRGIGKTAIAKAIYNEIASQFECSSFAENVGEISKCCGTQSLLQNILSDISKDRNLKIANVEAGIVMMKRMCNKKVLLVLDNVDDSKQLHEIAGNSNWFGKGSRVIITTRYEHLLEGYKADGVLDAIHTVDVMKFDESLELFNWYAFRGNSPSKEYIKYSNRVVRAANGLPLALKVSGMFFYGKDVSRWKCTLDKLKKTPEKEIKHVLETSCDALRDIDQQIFLDMACFFRRYRKRNCLPRLKDGIEFQVNKAAASMIQKYHLPDYRLKWKPSNAS